MTDRPMRRGNWSVQELERLRALLPDRGVDETATLLCRSADSVQRKALSLLRVPQRQGPWSHDEDRQLRRAWGALEPRLLGPLIGRPTAEVRMRAEALRRELRDGAWTREEQRALKKLYGTRCDEDLEVCLQRSRAEIRLVAEKLCLAKDKRFRARALAAPAASVGGRASMPRWTDSEVQKLRALYPDNDNLSVARALGRTVTSVANKAHQLGIKKSAAMLADIGRANISRRYREAGASAEGQGAGGAAAAEG